MNEDLIWCLIIWNIVLTGAVWYIIDWLIDASRAFKRLFELTSTIIEPDPDAPGDE